MSCPATTAREARPVKRYIRYGIASLACSFAAAATAGPPELAIAPAYLPGDGSSGFPIAVTLSLEPGRCVLGTFSPAASAVAQWQLTGPDGRPIPYSGPEAKIDYAAIVRRTGDDGRISATVRLFDEAEPSFDISAAGTYRLSLHWSMDERWRGPGYAAWFAHCEPWFGSLQSNTLSISIQR